MISSRKLAVAVSTSLVAVVLLVIFLRPTPREKYVSGYPLIQTGDTKDKVTELLGEPDEVSDCTSFQFSQAEASTKASCAEQYWYRGGLEQWLFVFDARGTLISKSHNISY